MNFQPVNPALEFPRDLVIIPIAVLGWGIYHGLVYRLIFKRIGDSWFPTKSSKLKASVIKENKDKNHKLQTALWKFAYFGTCVCIGFVIAWKEEWFFKPHTYYLNWPNHPMSDLIKFYYVVEMAGYIYSIVIMPFEPKQTKTDIAVLLIHHASTLFLLWRSYIYSFHQVGTAIAFLHDLADPLMELAKIFLYAGNHTMANIVFATFALVFMFTRNYIFPVHIILGISKYCRFASGELMPSNNLNYAFQGALSILALLHVYWAILILQMVYKALVNDGVEDDIRNVEKQKKE